MITEILTPTRELTLNLKRRVDGDATTCQTNCQTLRKDAASRSFRRKESFYQAVLPTFRR